MDNRVVIAFIQGSLVGALIPPVLATVIYLTFNFIYKITNQPFCSCGNGKFNFCCGVKRRKRDDNQLNEPINYPFPTTITFSGPDNNIFRTLYHDIPVSVSVARTPYHDIPASVPVAFRETTIRELTESQQLVEQPDKTTTPVPSTSEQHHYIKMESDKSINHRSPTMITFSGPDINGSESQHYDIPASIPVAVKEYSIQESTKSEEPVKQEDNTTTPAPSTSERYNYMKKEFFLPHTCSLTTIDETDNQYMKMGICKQHSYQNKPQKESKLNDNVETHIYEYVSPLTDQHGFCVGASSLPPSVPIFPTHLQAKYTNTNN
uniref:Uncharacterized protein n=1 Tax=Pasiphaea japonica whispovirus TaxID=2984286 RepID=A0A9C7EZC3_9VIRU|nr:MAG: hypothetical protein [Pasiphaea japonica whispovirus]